MNTLINYHKYSFTGFDNRPTCLVIMSAYNGERFIESQVESIMAQEDVDVKLLVRDDGSKDKTHSILSNLAERYKDSIFILSGENKGIHKSFKEVFDYANRLGHFDYISFSDQDDVWDKDKLKTAIGLLKEYGADFYSGSSRLVDRNMRSLGYETTNTKKYDFYMNGNSKILSSGAQGCTIVITRKLYFFFERAGLPEDYGHDTWIPIVSYYLFDCIYDSIPHMNYRQHDNSWTGNRGNKVKQMMTEAKHYFKGLSRYKPLAKDVLSSFGNDLSEMDKKVLYAVSGEKMNVFDRIRAISKYKFGKYGWKENLVYHVYYIFENK